jgi:AcrR family transcriptional regulator
MKLLNDKVRERIVETAMDSFYEVGFEKTTTRSIATKVGISVSNLYLYYENKEAIFSAIIDPYYVYLNSRFEELLGVKNTKEEINDKLGRLVKDLIVEDWRKFTLLIDKSSGTKYEGSKNMAIRELKKHIDLIIADSTIFDKELISYILSSNLINGIVEIAKNYQDELQLEDSLKHLIIYHTEGLKFLLGKLL